MKLVNSKISPGNISQNTRALFIVFLISAFKSVQDPAPSGHFSLSQSNNFELYQGHKSWGKSRKQHQVAHRDLSAPKLELVFTN